MENCSVCGEPIPVKRARRRAVTCSEECARKADAQRHMPVTDRLPSAIRQHANKLLVVADLLIRGIEVYDKVGTGRLVVTLDDRQWEVEIHSAYQRRDGKVHCSKIRGEEGMIYALVVGRQVCYEAPEEISGILPCETVV